MPFFFCIIKLCQSSHCVIPIFSTTDSMNGFQMYQDLSALCQPAGLKFHRAYRQVAFQLHVASFIHSGVLYNIADVSICTMTWKKLSYWKYINFPTPFVYYRNFPEPSVYLLSSTSPLFYHRNFPEPEVVLYFYCKVFILGLCISSLLD